MMMDDQTKNICTTSKRVCHLCFKEFSSGKALGGHMRIHKKSKDEDAEDVDDDDDSHNCVICRKDFPSRKSLYGHMRCHPGRGWKGVNPPSFHSSSGENKSGAHVDLTASLKGWPVTAERGRRATSSSSSEVSSSDVELVEAVRCLLMLSSVVREKKTPVENRLRLCDGEFERRRLKKKKKKRLLLSELEMDKYKCDKCDRSFSSHQAYGGHRSSHNKAKAFVRNSSLSSRVAASPTWRRGLGFDLNEVPSDVWV